MAQNEKRRAINREQDRLTREAAESTQYVIQYFYLFIWTEKLLG